MQGLMLIGWPGLGTDSQLPNLGLSRGSAPIIIKDRAGAKELCRRQSAAEYTWVSRYIVGNLKALPSRWGVELVRENFMAFYYREDYAGRRSFLSGLQMVKQLGGRWVDIIDGV